MTAEAVPQHMEALETAHASRMWRAGVKDLVAVLPHREGKLAVAALLTRRQRRDRPDHLATLPVYKLLGWIHHWQSVRTPNVLNSVGIGQGRQVGELTDRQRHALAELLTDGPAFSSARRAETERV